MKYEHTKLDVVGLTSQVQQDEMRLILAGMWPPLKPLPVFKYGTDEYRAEIHFDRTHGEWVCRKTSLPSHKVEELRGRLREMTMALPHSQADVFTEAVEAEPQEQELENEANRRVQAILEWRENYGNGARYSELQGYLSESQQDEIYDSIRMTLTARQLQFNPKNVDFVFDALWNAGGRLATLIKMAQQNKAEQEAKVQAPRYEGMFRSESTHEKHAFTVDGIKLQQWPLPIPAGPHSDAGHSAIGSAAEISASDFPQRLEASLPSERARHFVPEPIEVSIPELEESPTAEPVDGFIPTTVENFPTGPTVSPVAREILDAIFALLFAVIAFTLGLTAGRGPFGRSLRDTQNSIMAGDATSPALPNSPREATSPTSTPSAADTSDTPSLSPPSPETEELPTENTSAQSPNARAADSVIRVRPTGPSSAITSRSHIDSDHSSGANDLDDTPPSEEKHKELTRGYEASVKVSADSDSSPTTVSKPTAAPEASPDRSGSISLSARNVPVPATAEQPRSSMAGGPIPGARRNRALLTTEPVSATTGKLWPQTPSLKHAYPTVPVGTVRSAPRNVYLRTIKPVRGTVTKPLVPVVVTKHNRPAVTEGPKGEAPGNLAPRKVAPATGAALQPSRPSATLVTARPKGSKSRLTFPEKPIAASSSFAIASQLSVLVYPEAGPSVAHQPTRLQAGELVSYVLPRYPGLGDRYGSAETVKVRAFIGQLGQVLDVKLVSGSISLLPASMSAIRQWRYQPTLLNDKPVQAQQDITIEFRPPKYLSHVPTQSPSHK